MPTIHVQLTRTPSLQSDQSFQQVIVALGFSMPSELFVIIRSPRDPSQPSGATRENLSHIATPAELLNLPINNPLPGNFYFRTTTLSQVFHTRAEADDAWLAIQADVRSLVHAMILNAEGMAPTTVDITG
jgi:hypothetical protein